MVQLELEMRAVLQITPVLMMGLGPIICRVGLGSGRATLGFGSKNVGLCPAHDMVGLARNFMCNFRVGSDFFEFRIKYFGPYPTRHLDV
jgi:hypothetical protein